MTIVSRASSILSFVLAMAASGTAVTLSVLAGWERGGTVPEQAVWIAIGIVLVFGAHLLPALTRETSFIVRGVASVLWLACMTATCYGHVGFFLLAQQHAGERRVSAISAPSTILTNRNMTVVMEARAVVTAERAATDVIRCKGDCRTHDGRRATLDAKRDALDAEANEVRRNEAERDRDAVHREVLRADPVTSRLAVLLGTTVARVDLLSGLMFAAVLESVACLLWSVSLQSSQSPPKPALDSDVSEPDMERTPALAFDESSNGPPLMSREPATDSHVQSEGPVTSPPVAPPSEEPSANEDVVVLARDVEAGRLRPTVTGIRNHLRCSQARAVALRRQLLKSPS